jgi:peptidoglycan/LPS O-acetylase OafA/YrhL
MSDTQLLEVTNQPAPGGFGRESRILELDGLRGFAMLMLLFIHFVPVEYTGPGNRPLGQFMFILGNFLTSGVDCFFVLSGFVIGALLLASSESPSYYRNFYIRRYYRTFPLYFAWLLLSAAIALLWRREPAFAGFFRTPCFFLLFLLFVQNWFYGHNWFWKPSGASWYFLGQTWTIAVEEQYYLLAPFIVKKLSRKSLLWLLTSIVVAGPIVRYVEVRHVTYGFDAAYSWTTSRIDELAMGMLAALLITAASRREWIKRNLSLFYGLMTILFVAVLTQELFLFCNYSVWGATVGRSMMGAYYFCLILVLVNDPTTRTAALFRSRWLQKLAAISYGAYVMQLGVSFTCQRLLLHQRPQITTPAGFAVTLLSVALTLILAACSWKYFEKPLVQRGRRHRYPSEEKPQRSVDVNSTPALQAEGD